MWGKRKVIFYSPIIPPFCFFFAIATCGRIYEYFRGKCERLMSYLMSPRVNSLYYAKRGAVFPSIEKLLLVPTQFPSCLVDLISTPTPCLHFHSSPSGVLFALHNLKPFDLCDCCLFQHNNHNYRRHYYSIKQCFDINWIESSYAWLGHSLWKAVMTNKTDEQWRIHWMKR